VERKGGEEMGEQMKVRFKTVWVLLGICFLVATGCATQTAPMETISGAEMAIKVAEESDASVNAPLELKLAKDKLEQANAAVKQEEFEKAKRLADEAMVDARLAQTRSLADKQKKLAEEMRDSIEALQKEIKRSQEGK
jgi:hypothetical protein